VSSFREKFKAWDRDFGWTYRTALLLALLVTLVALPIWIFAHGRPPLTTPAGQVDAAQNGQVSPKSAGPTDELRSTNLYPYSVIPGGAHSRTELLRAIANDPIVAGHYANFDARKTRVIHLDHAQLAYVSYRIGAQIFWTRKALTIPAGETLLTDGKSTARTRCGNRLSFVPVVPVSRFEPPATAMDAAPDLHKYALVSEPNLPTGAPIWPAPPMPVTESAPPDGGAPTPGGPLPEPFPAPYFPILGVVTPGTPLGPPVPTPEPSSAALLCMGLAMLTFASVTIASRRKRSVAIAADSTSPK
jgi:hypothetical protein